jgi:8-oxo-dGTP diphosphatase
VRRSGIVSPPPSLAWSTRSSRFWPGHWSLLGGGCEPGEEPAEAIVRELDEEAGLHVEELRELFDVLDVHGSGHLITVFSTCWDGDERSLPLTEGVKLQFFPPHCLGALTMPPFIRDVIHRYLSPG